MKKSSKRWETGNYIYLFIFISLFLIGGRRTAFAHKISLFAYNDQESVITETVYSNNTPVQHVLISVASKNGSTILTGTADVKGVFTFPLEKIKEAVNKEPEIIVNATTGDGHSANWTIDKKSLPFYKSETPAPKTLEGAVPSSSLSQPVSDIKTMSESNPSTMSRDEALSEIKKLEKEILVLRRTAAKNSQNNSPGLREIFGGLGFILGISGLLAFMSVRKNNKINCETTSNKKDSGFNGIAGVFLAISLLIPPSVTAHFGVVLPSSNIVTPTNREITFTLAFCHPFEQVGMELIKPESFKSYFNGNETMLVNNLMETTFLKHRSWSVPFRPSRPGVYQFVMTPKPYWEEGEDCFIIHYTKTITAAFGVEEGWDKALGLPVEIVARTRPFGNYKGSSFTGQVLKDGTPLPDATVEVEYFNEGNRFMPKSMFHITQSIKSDPNGIFTINCPQAGWWSMAALTEGPTRIDSPEGPKNVEIGGILWIKVDEW